MGQKVNPTGLRLGINKSWSSNWYAEKDYPKFLQEDLKIKDYIKKNLKKAGIAKVEIGRAAKNLKVLIHASRPGIIIGRKGEEAEKITKSLEKLVNKELVVNIKEIKRPEINAQLIADNVALQLEKRVAYRRVIKRAMQNAMKFNALGCKIMVSGRLNGAEMARTEWIREGRVPLHTFRADIDYATSEAATIYGIIGVKVWVHKSDVATSQRIKSRRTK